jgi:hypothetical protein
MLLAKMLKIDFSLKSLRAKNVDWAYILIGPISLNLKICQPNSHLMSNKWSQNALI